MVALAALPEIATCATINVPSNQPTIQSGINAAANGDTVLVAPGTYFENLNLSGKAITLTSSNGPAQTTINGKQDGPAVIIDSGEVASTVVSGFTITNGLAAEVGPFLLDGGGIYIGASPTISGNIITENGACAGGGGILVAGGTPQILSNQILNNTASSGYGGGISVEGMIGNLVIQNNLISGNSASGISPGSYGGGIFLNGISTFTIVQNAIVNNQASYGGGVYLTGPGSSSTPAATPPES